MSLLVLITPVVLISAAYISYLVSLNVKDPFIDEIFHLRQCRTYCQFQFDVWDDKITTPPGLYLLGFAYTWLILWVRGIDIDTVCANYTVLRSVNLVGGLVLLPLIVNSFHKSKDQYWGINILCLPLVFAYCFLFYTDIWSLVLIIGALGSIYVSKFGAFATILSGFLGFLSLWFRQTNIIWIAFIASVYIDTQVEFNSLWDYLQSYVSKTWFKFFHLIPFAIDFILFVIFLKVNGGITFGDKENHAIQVHLVQVFYCFTFINVFTWPSWISVDRISLYIRFLTGSNPKTFVFHVIGNTLSFFVIKYIIDNFTIVHPFLLADNRHYTFYIWRKLLNHQYSNILAVPVYHFATWNIVYGLILNTEGLRLKPVAVLSYLLAIVLTIVPSPLFEPRYYLIPLVLFRIFTSPVDQRNIRNILEFVYLAAINLAFFVVFFKYEFTWDSEPGQIQRIIW